MVHCRYRQYICIYIYIQLINIHTVAYFSDWPELIAQNIKNNRVIDKLATD